MTKQKTKPSKKGPKMMRWSLGLFDSASRDGHRIAAYCRKDGSPVPYLAGKVKTKKALFHQVYTGMTFAEARARLLKDAAKAGVK